MSALDAARVELARHAPDHGALASSLRRRRGEPSRPAGLSLPVGARVYDLATGQVGVIGAGTRTQHLVSPARR